MTLLFTVMPYVGLQSRTVLEENDQVLLLALLKKQCAAKRRKHQFWANGIVKLLSNSFPHAGSWCCRAQQVNAITLLFFFFSNLRTSRFNLSKTITHMLTCVHSCTCTHTQIYRERERERVEWGMAPYPGKRPIPIYQESFDEKQSTLEWKRLILVPYKPRK